jgi:hypothetical protein
VYLNLYLLCVMSRYYLFTDHTLVSSSEASAIELTVQPVSAHLSKAAFMAALHYCIYLPIEGKERQA